MRDASTSPARSSAAARDQRARGRPRAGSPAGPGARPASSNGGFLEQRAGARRAAGPRGERAPQRREVVGRVDVEPERADVGDLQRWPGGARAGARGARRSPRRTPAPSRPAASAAARWCPVPWRSGTITTRLACASSALTSPGSSAGQSPGTSSTRSRAALERGVDPAVRRRRTGPPRPDRGRRHARCAARRPACAVTTITSSSSGTRASASQHVGDHRRGEPRAVCRSRRSSRCLARPKVFTGRIATVRIRASR